MPGDIYGKQLPTLDDNAYWDAFEAAPGDDTIFEQPTRAVWVGTGGDLVVEMLGHRGAPGATITYKNVADGTLMLIRVKRILESTTASNLVALT